MSDSDDAADPWDDRKRMRDDLRYKLNQLSDLFVVKGQPPRHFQARHGRQLDTVLDIVRDAIRTEALTETVFDRLARAGSVQAVDSSSPTKPPADVPSRRVFPREPRPTVEQLAASLEAVQDERDQLVLGKQAAEEAMADMKRRLAEAERRSAAAVVPHADSVAKLDTFRERVVGLNKEIQLLKEERDVLKDEVEQLTENLASYTEQGSLERFRAFNAIGSPEEIAEREQQVAALGSSLVLLLRDYDRTVREYEAVVGPLLLGFDRRSRQLESFYRAIAELAPLSPDRPLSLALAAILPSLGALTDRSTSSSGALDRLAEAADQQTNVEEGEVGAEPPASLFSQGNAQLIETVRAIVASQPLGAVSSRRTLLEALLPAPGADLFQQLVASRRISHGEPSVRSTTADDVGEASDRLHEGETTQPAIDLTASDASVAGSPSRPTGRSSNSARVKPCSRFTTHALL